MSNSGSWFTENYHHKRATLFGENIQPENLRIMWGHTHCMKQAFNEPYPSMEHKCTTMKEIERIIKSLKTKNTCKYY